jgi:periplasmic protein CpxP/Spy
MKARLLLIVALALPLAGEVAAAQGGARRRERIAAQGGALPRQQLEQRVRTGMARVVKQRIGLTDDQMSKLRVASTRYDARRRDLVRAERKQRVALRAQVLAGQNADQAQVAASLDGLLQIQKQRIDLQIEEQRQLAEFMSPVQRARYAALQEQIRRRVEGLRAGAAKTPADSE